MKVPRDDHPRPLRESIREYGRGLVGGLLISLPLLYTMEMWWAGFLLPPGRLLALLFFTFLLLLGYNLFAGIRHDSCFAEVAVDSVEELAVGIVTSALVLALLGRLSPQDPVEHNLGVVLVEAMIVSIGVSVGRAQLGDREEPDERPHSFGGQMVLALGGAVVFSTNVAATEEITELALESPPLLLLGFVAASVALGWAVLYGIDFRGAGRAGEDGPWLGALMTYLVAFGSSAIILWLFGSFDDTPLPAVVGQTIVLALPATLGASVGRFLVQS